MSPPVPAAAVLAGRWRVDPARSTAAFEVRSFGLRRVRGTLPVVDSLVVVDASGEPVAASATLDATGVDTGDARRDGDLRSKGSLLHVAVWPAVTFTAHRFSAVDGAWVVDGTLCVRDRRVGVQVTAEAVVDGDEATVRATTAFDRRDAGIGAPVVLIGHRIAVTVEVRLRREGS